MRNTEPALPRAEALCEEYALLPPGAAVVCALSGGADSVCLLHWLAQRGDLDLRAAHFNHQLRGEEAHRDEAFVRDLCARWSIPLTVGRGDVAAYAKEKGLSTEEAGRALRYAFLRETAGQALIATAHNSDDNAETVLLNLIRGTGLKGLGGIPPAQNGVVRPLLTTSREEIEGYLAAHQLPHVEDSTNSDDTYTRNRIRHQVLPLLRELNPGAVRHIDAAAAQALAADRYLDREARRAFVGLGTGPGWVSLPWDTLYRAPPPLRPRLILLLLDQLEVGRKDWGAVHFDALLRLENEHSLDLPGSVTARRERGRLFLSRRAAIPQGQIPLSLGVPLSWGGYTLTLLDYVQGEGLSLGLPDGAALTVGPCPPSGRLTLEGAKGSRTVKRLCLDRRIGLQERQGLPALYVDGRLAAVWPLGVDRAFLPSIEPLWFVQIKYRKKDDET